MPRLRAQLRRLLVLSLATPAATLVACRAADDGPARVDASSVDAAVAGDDACGPIEVDAAAFEDGSCGRFVRLPCGVPTALQGEQCYPAVDLCSAVCPDKVFFICQFPPVSCGEGGLLPDATVYLDCSTCLGSIGRRPAGLSRRPGRSRRGVPAVGRYLALAAYLEAASVDAFLELGARLEAFGAPRSLRRAALRAARDEKRHARVTARLARRHGAVREEPDRAPAAPLTLEELLTDNAVEGCVRETFGALVAQHQAARAADPLVARAMGPIAEDETRHAELAWAVHRWGSSRLPEAARGRIRLAQASALADLRASAGSWPEEVTRALGLPAPASEGPLVAAFARALFPDLDALRHQGNAGIEATPGDSSPLPS